MTLPRPKVSKNGYTCQELKSFLSKHKLKKFLKYICGRYVGNVRNQTIYYWWDVQQFLIDND